jgi:hypothetical protein
MRFLFFHKINFEGTRCLYISLNLFKIKVITFACFSDIAKRAFRVEIRLYASKEGDLKGILGLIPVFLMY